MFQWQFMVRAMFVPAGRHLSLLSSFPRRWFPSRSFVSSFRLFWMRCWYWVCLCAVFGWGHRFAGAVFSFVRGVSLFFVNVSLPHWVRGLQFSGAAHHFLHAVCIILLCFLQLQVLIFSSMRLFATCLACPWRSSVPRRSCLSSFTPISICLHFLFAVQLFVGIVLGYCRLQCSFVCPWRPLILSIFLFVQIGAAFHCLHLARSDLHVA